MHSDILQLLRTKLGEAVCAGPEVASGDAWIECQVDSLVQVARHLRDELGFDYLNSVTAVDYCAIDAKKKVSWQPHLEVVYHITNLSTRQAVVLKVMLARWQDDIAGQIPRCPSVAGIWSTADWHEREVYDLMGVEFAGHPNLVRILCPEDWVGHPLRKDYEMPLEYHGIRGR
jgi:NADH-quinone oxidoreductase subunit C